MDAMSHAIEGADVMLYGVSLAYKESSNCRPEANCESRNELQNSHILQLTQISLMSMFRLACRRSSAGSGYDTVSSTQAIRSAVICGVGTCFDGLLVLIG